MWRAQCTKRGDMTPALSNLLPGALLAAVLPAWSCSSWTCLRPAPVRRPAPTRARGASWRRTRAILRGTHAGYRDRAMRTVERILLVPIGAELAGAVAIARYITPPVHSLSLACFGLLDARGKYRLGCSASGLAPTPLRQWACTLALLMAPICPHWAEEVWSGPLAMPGCIVRARWPCPDVPVDASLAAAGDYLFSVAHSLSGSLSNFDKKAANGKAGGKAGEPAHRPNQINVYVVTRFPDWKVEWPTSQISVVQKDGEAGESRTDQLPVFPLLLLASSPKCSPHPPHPPHSSPFLNPPFRSRCWSSCSPTSPLRPTPSPRKSSPSWPRRPRSRPSTRERGRSSSPPRCGRRQPRMGPPRWP